MSDPTAQIPQPPAISDLQALEDLVVDNPDLERLELLFDQFNIFEAVGMVRQEIRHSDFLSFLLNPQQAHGLGDWFLRRLLQKAIYSNRSAPHEISLVDLDVWGLDDTLIFREWNNIDILMVNHTHRLAVIVENKIGAAEHSNQLDRYYRIVDREFPGYQSIALFLSPEQTPASDERYLPVGYSLVVDILEGLVRDRSSWLGEEIQVLIQHYTQMLRRHVLSDPAIDELCLRIYQRHQRALDLIFERRPDRQLELKRIVEEAISGTPDLVLDRSTKGEIDFALTEWDVPELCQGQGWTPSGRILLFLTENRPTGLRLLLYVGPGPLEVRRRLYQMALKHQPPFRAVGALRAKWNRIYTRNLLTGQALSEESMEELQTKFDKGWREFTEKDLPAIRQVVNSEAWIWEQAETPSE